LENPDFDQGIIEIWKEHCQACAFAKPIFSAFSRKMHKHGYQNEIGLYRMKLNNQSKFLGNFAFSPMYLYVKKNAAGELIEIETIPASMRPGFQDVVNSKVQTPGFKEKVKFDAHSQFYAHRRMENCADGWDVDFDLLPKEE
jgi:hypothetical protein